MFAVSAPAQITTTARIAARVRPESALRPPAWMFTTVPMVAPAPGSPPKRPDARLPTPCPSSSLSESICLRVKLPAITEVNKASTEPSIAKTSASIRMVCHWSMVNTGSCSEGRPEGISPMRRMS